MNGSPLEKGHETVPVLVQLAFNVISASVVGIAEVLNEIKHPAIGNNGVLPKWGS